MNIDKSLILETIACPLCGGEQFRPLLTCSDLLHHCPGQFHIVRCQDCSHAFLNPRPTIEAIGQFYPEEYGPHQGEKTSDSDDTQPASKHVDKTITQEKTPWYLKRWVKAIPGLRALYYWLTDDKSVIIPNISSSVTALDLGCATGNLLEKLREKGWNAQGVELAGSAVQTTRQKGFQVHQGTLESASFEDDQFRVITSSMVVEHLHDPKRTLAEVHRILEPGGTFILSVPNFGCWERFLFGKYWYALEVPRHLQHFRPRTIRSILHQSGFSSVKVIHQRNFNQVLGSLGIWMREKGFAPRLANRLINVPHRPSPISNLILAPFAHSAALLKQGGRLTIVAHKPANS